MVTFRLLFVMTHEKQLKYDYYVDWSLLHLAYFQLEDPCPPAGGDTVSTVTVELSRESLDTMLDGLGRIRDQLSVVAGK